MHPRRTDYRNNAITIYSLSAPELPVRGPTSDTACVEASAELVAKLIAKGGRVSR